VDNQAVTAARSRRPLVGLAVGLVVLLGLGYAWVRYADPVHAQPRSVGRHFMELKNAGDPRADDLLGPAPVIPDEPVSEAEADRLDAEVLLHGRLQIKDVRAEDGSHLALAAQGSYSARPLQVQTASGVERSQRVLTNPDIIVEVRDGKLYGVRLQLHHD
jgi:hypothetical protein